VYLAQGNLGTLALDTSLSTAVTLNGAPVAIGALPPGADVRASYVVVQGRLLALRIDAITRGY
jgi:hypothetical protein